MRTPVSAALVAALCFTFPAHAANDADLAEIRAQVKQMKETYEQRIAALENRLAEAEKTAIKAEKTAARTEAGVGQSAAEAAPKATAMTSASAFNPAIYAVLQGVYANLSQDPNKYAIHGFVPSGDIAPAKRGFSIAESELGFSANVDDKIYANLILSLSPDNSVEVEEAYGVLTALPGGFRPKFGRFLSSIGYLNDQHQHGWDFYDAPLPYQAFLGGQFRSDGLQLKWVAPTDTYLELGAEIGDGANFPGTERNRNGVGNYAMYAHAGGDIGASHSWRAGVSYLGLKPRDREYVQVDAAGVDSQMAFSGKSQLAIADFVWKYAPNGNAQNTNFKLQGEYFWRKESGDLTYDRDGALGLTNDSSYASRQSGWYLQSVYQFMPQWRFGVRYDQLATGRPDYGSNAAYLDSSGFNPKRYAAMIDYTTSEFGRFRLQAQQSKLLPDLTDNQVFLQYILTLGAHAAHKY
ncbi:carbohydrate porin [Accumulibacter sp.]|uniref:carbohydrate porin n=1 Tax=Accumulibacter sp. TaxID=2053492 RepID=UPI0026140B46|nr:carbohydrate porin [Accumulibacter sp.]